MPEQKTEVHIPTLSRSLTKRIERLLSDQDVLSGSTDADTLWLREYYQSLSPVERIEALRDKLILYLRLLPEWSEKDHSAALTSVDASRGQQDATVDAEKLPRIELSKEFLTELGILWGFNEVKDALPTLFELVLTERKKIRHSPLMRSIHAVQKELEGLQAVYEETRRAIFLDREHDPQKKTLMQTRLKAMAHRIIEIKQTLDVLKKPPRVELTPDVTDVLARLEYEELLRYRTQLVETGFVWTPSRTQIYDSVVASLQNGRWPMLIGEAGTGKSELADAAARAMTGENPLNVACTANTDEYQLITMPAMDQSGSFDRYLPLLAAASGYTSSRDQSPRPSGRIVRFDEVNRLRPEAPGYSLIKEARQLRPGMQYRGHTVLPGFAAIMTGNPVGMRYPDRSDFDPALAREVAMIPVDYLPMTQDNPELFEFMLAALMDEHGNIAVGVEELKPYWEYLAHGDPIKLPDGRRVVGEFSLVHTPDDIRHGYLYRLAFALRAIQSAFIRGNEDIDGSLLKNLEIFYEEDDGKLYGVGDGFSAVSPKAKPLSLSKAVVTLGEIASWMKGFQHRYEKDDPEFHVATLTEWMQLKLHQFIDNASDVEDKKTIKKLFDHFGLLDDYDRKEMALPSRDAILTPLQIGYLSPRTPRYIDVRSVAGLGESTEPPSLPYTQVLDEQRMEYLELYDQDIVTTVDGVQVTMRIGDRHILDEKIYTYLGVTTDGAPHFRVNKLEQNVNDSDAEWIATLSREEIVGHLDQDRSLLAREILGDHFLGFSAIDKVNAYLLTKNHGLSLVETAAQLSLSAQELEALRDNHCYLLCPVHVRQGFGKPEVLTLEMMLNLFSGIHHKDARLFLSGTANFPALLHETRLKEAWSVVASAESPDTLPQDIGRYLYAPELLNAESIHRLPRILWMITTNFVENGVLPSTISSFGNSKFGKEYAGSVLNGDVYISIPPKQLSDKNRHLFVEYHQHSFPTAPIATQQSRTHRAVAWLREY